MINQWNLLNARLILAGDFPDNFDICDMDAKKKFGSVKKSRNYFTSCDPHHDIYTFCYWQIFWHSI